MPPSTMEKFLNSVDHRLYTLEQMVTSESLNSNEFDEIYITDPTNVGSPVVVGYTTAAPTAISAVMGSLYENIYADVTWTPPAGNTLGYTYELEWAKKVGGVYQLINAMGGIGGNSYRVERLEPNTTYGFRVVAVNAAKRRSAYFPSSGFTDVASGQDATTPAPPTGLTVVSTIKSLIVRINANTEFDVANGKGLYKFELSTNNTFTNIIKTNREGGLVSYFPDLDVNTTYYIRVTAIDQSGNESGVSATGSGTTGFIGGSDTNMQTGGVNIVKNSTFVRRWSTNVTLPDAWSIPHPNSNTQGIWTLTAPGGVQGDALKIEAAVSATYYAYQIITVTKGNWILGCRVKRTGVTGSMSGLNMDVSSGSVSGVRRWPGAPVAGDVWDLLGSGTHDWQWEWSVISVTSDSAVIYVYCHHGYFGGSTGNTQWGEIQVQRGDTPTAWQGIPASVIGADEVYAGSMTTAIFTVNTLNGDRLLANSAVIEKISSSSMTTVNLTLNGGSMIAGSPPTTGLLLNSQGLRLYAGGVATVILDSASGTGTFTGTINASAGTLGGLTVNGWLTITSSGLRTASSGHRLEIPAGFAGVHEISFYTGNEGTAGYSRGYLQMNSGGTMVLKPSKTPSTTDMHMAFQSASIDFYNDGTKLLIRSGYVDAYTQWYFASNVNVAGATFSDNYISTKANVVFGQSYNGGVYPNLGVGHAADTNWGMGVTNDGTNVYTTLRYYTAANRYCGIFNTNGGIWIAYGDPTGTWVVPSTKINKRNIRKVVTQGERGESSLAKVKQFIPVRYHDKHDETKTERFSLLAEDVFKVLPEAVSVHQRTDGTVGPAGLIQATLIATLAHAVQEIDNKYDTKIENLEKALVAKQQQQITELQQLVGTMKTQILALQKNKK